MTDRKAVKVVPVEANKVGRGKSGKRPGARSLLRLLPLEPFAAFSRQQLRSPGTIVLAAACLSFLLLWAALSLSTARPALVIGAKASAFLAIILLSLNFILATRSRALEGAFGGLDRMYKVHKMVGKLALLFAILHPLLLVASRAGDLQAIGSLLVPGLNAPYTLGLLSTVAMLVLVAITVRSPLPYRIWRLTHRLLVLPLMLAMVHALLSGSDVNRYPILAYLVVGVSLLGMLSYLYVLLLYRRLGPRASGTVLTVRRLGSITELTIAPETPLNFHPGQFIFIRFLRFSDVKESFPFSISSDALDGVVRISVKAAGDFTSGALTTSQPGDKVEMMGPYGKFGERYLAHRRDMVWIAGGIGITPFLSMAKHECRQPAGRRV
ncbi:MAG: ferric reductase-like transmembrane domain-containing protein, partial [Methanomassiliicoccales archaeon]|nr:ferric reductase-like transmembrane domain-containing protein [Methanomassiliicoccales archaeon]